MKEKTYKLSVFRFDPLFDTKQSFKSFNVPRSEAKTVLDALLYIRDHFDGTLAFRASCNQGRCGSCAMHINGEYGLACETPLHPGKTTIRPLAQLPIIKDLMVDMERFWEKYESIKPYLVRHSGEARQSFTNRKEMDSMIDCILCGACFSACMMTGLNPEFHGPAAYVTLNRFLRDERDAIHDQRMELVTGENGVFRCHSMYNCNDACPKNVKPSENILEIKKNIG
ncbi:MAG: succinate dehydrogenase iron-sulfur subunit [Candidatus Marinimicrobia bacterium]|nr:succinate dehydrogenase iron-sulfur subunit [Candidatus Neomarinimicrobiota bacterium]